MTGKLGVMLDFTDAKQNAMTNITDELVEWIEAQRMAKEIKIHHLVTLFCLQRRMDGIDKSNVLMNAQLAAGSGYGYGLFIHA